MPIVITVASPKGGVAKTTTTANLGAILADLGLSVLLIDCDRQGSLSRAFDFQPAALGVRSVFETQRIDPAAVSPCTTVDNLALVRNDDPDGSINRFILEAIAGHLPLMWALDALDQGDDAEGDAYDVVLIDTPGTISPIRTAALCAANIILSPVKPDTLSAEVLVDDLKTFHRSLAPIRQFGRPIPQVRVLLSMSKRTTLAQTVTAILRQTYMATANVAMLDVEIPDSAVFPSAFATRTPAHRYERRRRGPSPSAAEVMHLLAWQLFPNLVGREVG